MSDVVATGILNIQTQVDTAQTQAALNRANAQILSAATRTAGQIQSAHEKAFSNIAAAGKKLSESIDKTLDAGLETVTSTIKTLGAVGGAALAGFTEEVIRTGVELNNASAQATLFFNAFTGSADKANAILEQINKTAENNPLFSKETLLAGARQLAASGAQLSTIPTTLNAVAKAIGAVGGSAGQVQQVVSVLSRVNTVGLLSTRQFVALKNSGIDAAGVIGKQLGITADQVQNQLKQGFLTGRQAADALVKGLQTQFGSLDETIGKTLPQATSLFRNSIAELGGELTKAFVNPTGGGAAVNLFNDLAAAITHLKEIAAPLQQLLQPIADDLTKVGEAAKNFVEGISTADVQKFVNFIKDLGPVLAIAAGFFSSFTTKLLEGLPVIGRFVPELEPLEAIFIAVGLAIPQVREQIVRVAETISTELKPVIAALIPALKDAQKAIGDLAKPIGDVLVRTIKDVAPSLVTIINLIKTFIDIVAPIAKVAISFTPIKDILEVLIIRFALLKLGVIDTLNTIASKATSAFSSLKNAAPVVTATPGAAPAAAGFSAPAQTATGEATAVVASQAAQQTAIRATIVALNEKAAAEQEVIGFVTAETEAELTNAEAQLQSATAAETSSGILVAAKGAAAGLGTAIGGLVNPITLAIGAFIIYNKIVGDAKTKTEELFKAATQGLDLASIEGQNAALKILDDQVGKTSDKFKQQTGIVNTLKEGVISIAIPGAGLLFGKDVLSTSSQLTDQAKKRADLQKDIATRDDIIAQTTAKTGKSTAEIIELAKTLPNVDIFHTSKEGEQNVIKAIVDAATNGASKINDANESILQTADDVAAGIQQNIAAAVKPINELLSGQKAVNDAVIATKDAQFQLNDLLRQRSLLQNNIAAKENETASATFKVIDANRSLLDLQNQRDEAIFNEQERVRKFNEDQASFGDKVLQNQIDQRKAQLDVVDAQRQLLFLQRQQSLGPQGLNLAGLSIDEARRRVAAATSNLANQQTSNQQGTLARQVAEQQDAVTSAQIKQRDTLRSSVDLQVENNNAIHANAVATAKFAEDTAKFNEDSQKAQLAINVAVEEQKNLQNGLIGTNQTLLGLNHQIEGSQRAVSAALNAQQTAQDNLKNTIATQAGDVQGMVAANAALLSDKLNQVKPGGVEDVILGKYKDQLGVLNDIGAQQKQISDTNRRNDVISNFTDELKANISNIDALKDKNPNNIVRQSEQTTLVSVLNQLKPFIQNASGQPAGLALQPKQISDLASSAIDALVKNPSSDLNQILRDILNAIGLSIPGFAEGGLITSERLIRAGEQNRMEAILPLTKPANLQNLLSQPAILNPILAALPRISMPNGVNAAQVNASMQSIYGSGGAANARIDQEASEDRMARKIARALADEMQQRQLGNVKIDAPVTVTPHRLQSEDDIAKSVAREIIRKLR